MSRISPVGTGLLLCALAGCQSYAPYGPGYMNGGYASGPTYAPAPAYGSAPVNGTYLQPQPAPVYGTTRQAVPPGAPLYTPRSAPYPAGRQQLPIPAGQPGNATLPPGMGSPKTVPLPIDPGPGRLEGEEPVPAIKVPGAGSGTPSNLGTPSDALGEEEFQKPVGSNPQNNLNTAELPDDTGATIRKKMGPSSFKGPTSLPGGKGASNTKGINFESSTSTSSDSTRLNPYGFDRTGYTWLRGKLDYDQIDKRWHITYLTLDGDVTEPDSYGGGLTLAPHKALEESGFLNGDVVFVLGGIDANQRDRFKKPVYSIKKIVRLQDPSAIAQESTEQP